MRATAPRSPTPSAARTACWAPSVRLDRALLDPALDLHIISTISVGVDQFDVDYLRERGILLANTPDVLTETTADTIFALILASARRVVGQPNSSRRGAGRAA